MAQHTPFAQTSFSATTSPRRSRAEPQYQSFDCGIHDITYRAYRPGCPSCELERDRDQLRDAVQEISGKYESTKHALDTALAELDISRAIREAQDLMEDDDILFFKQVLYEYRDSKSTMLKVQTRPRMKTSKTTGRTYPSKKRYPSGFMAIPKQGDPWIYWCNSIGGIAVAEYMNEAINSYGQVKAMDILCRGLSQMLPGSAA